MKKNKLLSVEKVAKDIAQQPNEITQAVFKGTAMSYKLILFALYKTVHQRNPIEPAQKNVYCGFSRNEFCEKMGIPLGANTLKIIEKATDELSSSFLILRDENATNDKDIYSLKIPWFQKVETMLNGNVNLKFNQEIANFFDFKTGYTALELLEIGNLQSFYAMRYYGFAKSKIGYKSTKGNEKNLWWFEFTEAELRKLFDLDKNKYKVRMDFVKKVIINPCEEINEKTNIHIDLEYIKISKGNYKWRFNCSEKIEQLKITISNTKIERNLKRDINKEQIAIAKLRKAHANRWQEVFEFEMTQPCLFGGEDVKKTCAKNKADLTLFQEFGDELN